MTLTDPTYLGPVPPINPADVGFATIGTVQPFSPRTGIGYQDLLESLRVYVQNDLYTFLVNSNPQGVWNANVDKLIDAVQAKITEWDTQLTTEIPGTVSTELAAQLQAILETDAGITDPTVSAVLNAPTSASRDFLDGRYLPSAKKNAITGAYHIDGYGASPTATGAVNRAAIQHAVDDANAAYLATGARQKIIVPGNTYPVDLVPYYAADGTTQRGVAAVVARSGVDWDIHGIIKLNANAFSAATLATGYGAIVRSAPGGLSHVAFRGIAQGGFDGNSSANPTGVVVGGNVTGVSNMELSAVDDVTVADTTQTNSSLQGVRITAPSSVPVSTHIRVNRNKVSNIAGIGLQVSNFDGLQMNDNMVDTTGDNALDVYGENGTSTSTGTNFVIRGNIVRNAATGIFLETVAYGVCSDNVSVSCPTGIHLNRINGEPRNVAIHGNTIYGGTTAIFLTGSMRSILVHNNTARGFTGQGIQFGSGSSTTANIVADNNMLDGTDATVPLYRFSGSSVTTVTVANPRSFTVTDPTVTYTQDAGTSVSTTTVKMDPAIPAPKSVSASGSVASGGTATVTIPKAKGGLLTIEANSGGSWYSVWSGIVNGGNGRVDVAQLATSGATPGNAISTVVGSTTSNDVLITFRATGSAVSYVYRYDPVS